MTAFHFNKQTVEASCWCNTCNRFTPWKIADGRRQFCLVCYDKPVEKNEKRERKPGDRGAGETSGTLPF